MSSIEASERRIVPNERHPDTERYGRRMDAGLVEKIAAIVPNLVIRPGRNRYVSVGFGTASFEAYIAETIPGAEVIGIDASRVMLVKGVKRAENIVNQYDTYGVLGGRAYEANSVLRPIEAWAEALPLVSNSMDGAIDCSVDHEIASYGDHFRFGKAIGSHFREVARVLKPGSTLVVKDFMALPHPHNSVIMEIGQIQRPQDMNPALFMDRFCTEFDGLNLQYLTDEIDRLKRRNMWKAGAQLFVKEGDLVDILGHYSWASAWEREIRERYAYLDPQAYGQFIADQFRLAGFAARIKKAYTFEQPGYTHNLRDRLNLFTIDGKPRRFPHLCGIVVVEKMAGK